MNSEAERSGLAGAREALDAVDRRIVDALAERVALVRGVADHKLASEAAEPVRDAAREEDLLTRVAELGRAAGVDQALVARLYREILDHSVRVQEGALTGVGAADVEGQRARVVYEGAPGAFSHMAAAQHFAGREDSVRLDGLDHLRALGEAVSDGDADYAVLPIENTLSGTIPETWDLIDELDLRLVGEEVITVEHCLLTLEPMPLTHIRRVISREQALSQCRGLLRSLEGVEVQAFGNTALSARKVQTDQDPSQAAIASLEAARAYDLHVLKRGIADLADNRTRFVVVAREAVTPDLRLPCKTSLVVGTRHEPGALLAVLNALADHGLNLSKLESRPRRDMPWDYMFYVDLEGNAADPEVAEALDAARAEARFLKVLGSYPARTTEKLAKARPAGAASAAPADPAPPPAPAPTSEAEVVRELLARKPYRLASRLGRAEDSRVRVGDAEFGGAEPIIIAGPCSVESREQVMAAAAAVHDQGGHVLRGGCFKPRTSPYAFQGLGYEGLELLAEAGRAVGLPIVTEVLHPKDVAPVARIADMLQIGARNMQNFALLKAAGAVDRPVMLKRGLMASVDEWLAAAEYVLAHGNQQVVLCERGIRTFETATRNTLDLSSVPVVRERSHLPVIVDPSHAAGTRRWIPDLCRAALAVGAHGLMVEVHPCPAEALSDGPQALTFEGWAALMADLGPPGPTGEEGEER